MPARKIIRNIRNHVGKSIAANSEPSGGVSTIARRAVKVVAPPAPEKLSESNIKESLEKTSQKAAEAVSAKLDLNGMQAWAEDYMAAQTQGSMALRRALSDGVLSMQEVATTLIALTEDIGKLASQQVDLGSTLVHEGSRAAVGSKGAFDAVHNLNAKLHEKLVNSGIAPSGSWTTDIGHGAWFVGDVRVDILSLALTYAVTRALKFVAPMASNAKFTDTLFSTQRELKMTELVFQYTFLQGAEAGPQGTITLTVPTHVTHFGFTRELTGVPDTYEYVRLDRAAVGMTAEQTSLVIRSAAGDTRTSLVTVGTAPAMRLLRTVPDSAVPAGGYVIDGLSISSIAASIDPRGLVAAAGVLAAFASENKALGPAVTILTPWLSKLVSHTSASHGGAAYAPISPGAAFAS